FPSPTLFRSRLRRVIRIRLQLRVRAEHLGGQRTERLNGLARVNHLDERFHVNGVVDRLAHQRVVEGRLLHVEAYVAGGQALGREDLDVRVELQAHPVDGLEVVGDVDAAGLKLDGADRAFGNGPDDDP